MVELDSQLAEKAMRAIIESVAVLAVSDVADGRTALEQGRDIKLEADYFLHTELCSRLMRKTHIHSMSEEDLQSHGNLGNTTVWIIDPLDGSMNYSRGLPLYCISVALWRDGEPVIGIIHDMERNRTFSAYDGLSRVDDREIRVGTAESISFAVLATGFPLLSDSSSKAMRWFLDVAKRFKKVRMLGTAALSLAWVAEGRLDAYFERDIMVWDVAAGAALVRGAGGLCMMLPGRYPMSLDVLAANPKLTVDMKELLGW
jgi:myo-inositol-1(or 4)-monophosphatase